MVLLALAAGSFLRLWNLRHQLLLGDEFHAIRAALDWELPRILTTYRLADNSIPLTAFYRLLTELGVVLDETVLRLPSMLAGLALLIVLPWLAGTWLGGRTSFHVAWLVAISPSLVYYARSSRPYAITTLLCLVAVVSYWQWWERERHWWWGAVYCFCGAAAVWFHLGTAPLVAAPLVFAGLEVGQRFAMRSADAWPGLRRLVLAAGALLSLVALILLPARETFLRLLRVRRGDSSPTSESVFGTLALESGTAHWWLVALFWGVALVGLLALWRERRRLAAYLTCAVAVQWVAIAVVLRPSGIGHTIVLNRYLIATLPIVLLWTAYGMDRVIPLLQLGQFRWGQRMAPAAFVMVLVLAGPFVADPYLHFGSFAGSNDAINFLKRQPELPSQIPNAYLALAREPGQEPVLEARRHTSWWSNRSPLAYSRVHGRRVLIGADERRLTDPRLHLRNVVPLSSVSLFNSGARFVIVDLDPRDPTRGPRTGDLPKTRRAVEAQRLATRLEEEWGEPALVDGSIRVWDLARVRWSRD